MAAHWALIMIVTLLWNKQCQGQTCAMGFLTTVTDCTDCGFREDNRDALTRIIPDMNFNCSGAVTYWRAAGEFVTGGNSNRSSALSIWRERSNEPGTYDRIGIIELGRCGGEHRAPLVMGMNNVYQCILQKTEWVAYQPGDIFGIELPTTNNVKFRFRININHGSRNYIFSGYSSFVYLNQNVHAVAQDLPQISLNMQSSATSMDEEPVVGGVVGITLLLALVLSIILALVCLTRKHNRSRDSARDRETRIGMAQNVNTVDIETKANLSYVPVFRQILTGDNIAYERNQANNGDYLTILSSAEDNIQAHGDTVTQLNEEDQQDHSYDYIN